MNEKNIDDLIKTLDENFEKGVGHISVKADKNKEFIINKTNQSCGENSPCSIDGCWED